MRTRENLIQIRTTETEYKRISENAKKLNMKVAPYVRLVAQNPNVLVCDYDIIANHTKEIADVRATINQLIFTIEATNNYLPKDIETIVELITEIFKSENKLRRELRNDRINFYKNPPDFL